MKKTIYAIAALALVFTGCTKEFNETFAPGDVVTIHATVNDTYTKVAADNEGKFSWQAVDAITILNSAGTAYQFSTVNGGDDAAFTSDAFSGSLSEKAYYPASGSHTSTQFNLESSFEWKADECLMPMIGTVNTSAKTVSFVTTGAVIKLVCYNVSDDARKLVVSSDSKKLSGLFTPSEGAIVSSDSASDKTITITFGAGHPSTMVFYIPVPTGNLGKLSFVVRDDSDNNLSSPLETKGAIEMSRKHIVVAPALNCSSELILWSEDFSSFSTGTQTGIGYGGVDITYTTNDSGTKTYNEKLAGGTAPELLIKGNKTFVVSGIPTNSASSLAVKYKTNAKSLSLSSSTDGISFSPSSSSTSGEHCLL